MNKKTETNQEALTRLVAEHKEKHRLAVIKCRKELEEEKRCNEDTYYEPNPAIPLIQDRWS